MLGTATIRTYLTVGPDFDDLVCVYTSGRIVQCGKRRVVNHKQIDRRADKSPLRAACAPAGVAREPARAGGGRGAPGPAGVAGCWKPRLHTRGHETVLIKVSHS